MRFNQVFFALMAGAFLCAFVLPQGLIDPARVHVAGIFNPLSYPIRRAAKLVFGSFDRQSTTDARSEDTILAENSQLRQQVAQLTATVEELRKIDGDRRNLGGLKSSSMRLEVAGADAAGRDVLLLKVSPLTQLIADSPVYSPLGLVGRLDAGRGGARVRLITDDGFAVTGAFYGFRSNGKSVVPTAITAPTPLVKGRGQGRLEIVGMKSADFILAGLRVGDWVVLDDKQWPPAMQSEYLGRVVSAKPSRATPGFMDIQLAPEADLMRLDSVWVLDHP